MSKLIPPESSPGPPARGSFFGLITFRVEEVDFDTAQTYATLIGEPVLVESLGTVVLIHPRE